MQSELSPSRIRHISALHIRHLTPFPRRDQFTSNLSREYPRTTTDDSLLPSLSSPPKSIRSHRNRTNSTASRPPYADNYSQHALQNIIASRLVQTFVTISIPDPPIPNQKSHRSPPDSAPPFRSSFTASPPDSAPPFRSSFNPSPRRPRFDPKGKAPANDPTPVYFSPIHRPSTNPFFPIDTRSRRDFPLHADLTGQSLSVHVWGKPITHQSSSDPLYGWSLLDEWHFDLNQLVPLPEDIDTLPSNVLLVTLSPPGQTFYLPSITSSSLSRSSSPSAGYASDPESEIRKAKHVDNVSAIQPLSRRRRHRNRVDSTAGSRETLSKTAGWQELFKLVTLQSCVLDNEQSVAEVIRNIDGLLEDDGAFSRRRQISEREARIQDLRRNHDTVLEQCAKKRAEIAAHKQKLLQRSETLQSARMALDVPSDLGQVIEVERRQLTELHAHMTSIRTSLLSTLSTIFPIELLSPPDLLFTILDVPLPIPVNANDPAPPLTLPEHKEVTEEAVAAALGFVAQVLQILAAYLGKGLVYPVTCIGSRSLIRDGISAMVGPRMFPLFSKGVDTYRFEYGVFLLNKDIEMLMSERDLRALDIRHTLPNLKNLMLTLSHDNGPTTIRLIKRAPSPISSMSSTSGLETPSRSSSPANDDFADVSTPKASQIITMNNTSMDGASRSGATTPTASVHEGTTKSKSSFLGFGVPFWGRSASQNVDSKEEEDSENGSSLEDSDSSGADVEMDGVEDEDDGRTIHGVAVTDTLNPSEVQVAMES